MDNYSYVNKIQNKLLEKYSKQAQEENKQIKDILVGEEDKNDYALLDSLTQA